MCFEQKSTRDPKVLCSTRINSKRNSSRLDMHRKVKNCNLSLENVANSEPFVIKPFTIRSNEMTKLRPFKRFQLHKSFKSWTSSKNIVIPSNRSGCQFKKPIAILSKGSQELSVRKQSTTFQTAFHNSCRKRIISRLS